MTAQANTRQHQKKDQIGAINQMADGAGRERIHWLDAARTLAIIAVLTCHSVEGIYSLNLDSMSSASQASEAIAFIGFTFGRIGVPLFLFISGYLLLDRDWNRASCVRFWKRRWLPLLLCVEIWIVIYSIFLMFAGNPISVEKTLRTMLFVDNIPMGHYWYMPMILGFYLFLPIMGIALRKLDVKTIAFPLVVVSIYALGVPVAKQIVNAVGTDSVGLAARLDLGFSGGVYGIYLILGWCAKKGAFKKLRAPTLTAATATLFALCVAFQLWCYGSDVQYNIWYSNGLLLLCSLALFELFSRLQKKLFTYTPPCDDIIPDESSKLTLFGRITYWLSYYSFAVYLTHFPLRMLILPFFKQLNLPMSIRALALFAFTLVTSLCLCWILSKIPRIGKALLYLK